MVYITSDGRIVQQRPWGLRHLLGFFWAIINFFLYFFKSLFGLDNFQTFGSRKGGGGGGGGGGPGRPSGGPRRNVQTFREMKDIQDCSMPGGG